MRVVKVACCQRTTPSCRRWCDALSFAAQLEMSDAIACQDVPARERAYGKWLALRGLLRAVEGRIDEWRPVEIEMLGGIDWQLRSRGSRRSMGPCASPLTVTELNPNRAPDRAR
jgi:hypothetical protein